MGADPALHFKVSYRGKLYQLQRPGDETLEGLAGHLGHLTGASLDTIKLILPQSKRASLGKAAPSALQPCSDGWGSSTLEGIGITEGITMLMSGASTAEVAEVSKPSSSGIADFNHEERRARARAQRKRKVRALPTGPYVFADFRTLTLPGVELHPPEAKALKLMHKLASDPGVVAIMNKYKWRVGIMTELAPEGYVGVSPVCLLGFNRNRGMEISLRLRTDDLAGFRKYDSIRKTLLHELTHMVYDDHDEDFKALNSRLNREAEELDWTKKTAHTLGGKAVESDEESESSEEEVGQVLGGGVGKAAALDPRQAAAAAAMRRDAEKRRREAEGRETADVADDVIMDEPRVSRTQAERGALSAEQGRESAGVCEESPMEVEETLERWEGDRFQRGAKIEKSSASRDEASGGQKRVDKPVASHKGEEARGVLASQGLLEDRGEKRREHGTVASSRDVGSSGQRSESQSVKAKMGAFRKEPDPDDPDDSLPKQESRKVAGAPFEENPAEAAAMEAEVVGGKTVRLVQESTKQELPSALEAPGGDVEWQRAQEAAAEASGRVQKAVAELKRQAGPGEVTLTLKTLATILRNVMEHPREGKYRRVRKTNATFFQRVGRYEAAIDVLHAAGFREDDSSGTMVLQRDDPGLLWLTCSLLEGSLA